jgi:hypothetical protein
MYASAENTPTAASVRIFLLEKVSFADFESFDIIHLID